MRSWSTIVLLAGLLGAVLVAGSVSVRATDGELPGPDGAALWTYLTKTDPYLEWGFWPDHEGMQDGEAPHGPRHKVYVNKVALEAAGVPLPAGSIQVKESYNEKEKLKAITVMYKIAGYDPDHGDWFWAQYSAEGKLKKAGKLRGCAGCHSHAAENDWVYVHAIE